MLHAGTQRELHNPAWQPAGHVPTACRLWRRTGGRLRSLPGQPLHEGDVAGGEEGDGQRVQAQAVVGGPGEQQDVVVLGGGMHWARGYGFVQDHVEGELIGDAQRGIGLGLQRYSAVQYSTAGGTGP